MDTEPCLQCKACDLNWPDVEELYGECPKCELPTMPVTGFPLPADAALSLRKHALFDRYYVEREAMALRIELDTLAA